MSAILPHMVWPYGYSIPLTNMRRPSLSFRIDSYSPCCLQETYNTDIYYCAPAWMQSVAMSMSVSSHISRAHAQTSQNFLYMLTVATDRSSPDTTSNVVPVLWMTSRLPMIWRVDPVGLIDRVERTDRLGCFVDRLDRLVDDFTTRLG